MANLLKMATIETILGLHRRHWSIRKIAKELGVHRDTVARHIRLAAKQAGAPPGSEAPPEAKIGHPEGGAQGVKIGHPEGGAQEAKLGQALIGWGESAVVEAATSLESSSVPDRATQASLCEPFRDAILAKLEQDLSAQRIHQDLVADHGFLGKYHSVRRFVRQLCRGRVFPFRRMECGPGEEAQVDFGTGAPIVTPEGKRRRPHVFRIVLSYSRKAYSEVVYRQTTEDFIRCLENAFQYFGGVPKVLVIDNLKAAVSEADWFDADLNPKIRAFCAHYGTAMLPTKPRTPRHKGKIESSVGYVKKNALKGRTFVSLEEENGFLLDWETTVADARVHGTTRRPVGKVFAEEERPALQPLPAERFPFFHEGERMVHRDGHVEVARAYYSVPPEYLGRRVWVRWDGRLVRVCNERLEQIAVHAQREPGRFSTQDGHIVAEKISGIERGVDWMMTRIQRIGAHATAWAQAVVDVRGIEGVRVLQGLLALSKKHRFRALDQACASAHAAASYRLKTVRQLLAKPRSPAPAFDFMDKHPLIRELADYELWLRDALARKVEA